MERLISKSKEDVGMKKKVFLVVSVLILVLGNFLLNTGINSTNPDGDTNSQINNPAKTAQSPAEALTASVEPGSSPVPTATPVPTPTPAPSPTPVPTPSPEPTPTPVPLTEEEKLGQDIANFALGFWGSNYKYGGESPETGFDCSGLIFYVYGQFGYKLERVAAAQAMQGIEVPKEEIRPGDVLCFFYPGQKVSHMGLYVGYGCYIHARGQAYGVMVSPIDHPDRDRDYIVKRFIGCDELKLPPGAPPPTA